MSEPVDAEIALLNASLELPQGDRAAYLDQACGGNAALREQVEALLAVHTQAEGFMEVPPTHLELKKTELVQVPVTEKPGDRIGRYKLLQQIGEGGCGVVYMAEQEEPVRRRVALKVIKLGMDTKQVIARFEAERQALALMDHPNIAKVLDAGATEAGRPYFVMELVRGTKITEFCDEAKSSTLERLNLIIQVCQAIQHAHQKGIIHRDIKPSNILVTINDGVAVPKVIDFGIAKATSGRLTDRTLFTAFEQFMGTPAYMSPEQAVMTTLDIDTRSDIYSLGVLLYELLTGKTPFDARELYEAGFEEMRRTIREKEPPRPSTRLSTMEAEALSTTAQLRHTDPPRLLHVVRGDLDWIVMKCLEKDRARRYETANGLAADIGHYLKNEPIVARPPSQLYSLQKLARRNRAALLAASFIMLVLLLAVVVLATSNLRIRDEQSQKKTALERAQKNEQEARAQLCTSLKSQAEARRYSHRIGQRTESLAALDKAVQIKRDEDLRDAVIATLAVPDVRPGASWRAYDTNDWLITFDANYERYALIDGHSVIRIHAVADDREIQRFSSGPLPQRLDHDWALRFSPDGRQLAKYEVNNRWSIWRVDDGQLVLRTPRATRAACAFSPDSTQLAISIEDSIVILDAHTGAEQKRWRFQHLPHSLEFSPDGRQLAVGPKSSEVVSIYNVATAQLTSELRVGPGEEKVVTWHASGAYLAVSSLAQIQLWDVKAATRVSVAEGHAQQVTTLSFDPSGNWLISDSWDGTPRLWQPSPGQEQMRIFSGLNHLRFSKDGRWAGVIYPGEGQAQLLEFIPSRIYHTFFGSLGDSQRSFTGGSISPDGRLLALASTDVSIRELPGGRELARLPTGYSHFVLFHPNGKELLVSGPRPAFEIWPMTRDATAPNKIHFGPPRRLPLPFVPFDFALARDGRTLAVAAAHAAEARIMDFNTGNLRDLKFPHPNTDRVALSPDARWVAASGWHSTQAQLWDAQTGERLLNVAGDRARVSLTPDGLEFVVAMSQAYVFYDIKTRKVSKRFQLQGNMHPGRIAFTHDGKLMAMEIAPGLIRLCEVETGRTIAHLQDPTGAANGWMGFTPDGTQLIVAATYDRAIHRWDLRALRVELKAMGLDWDWPGFPPQSEPERNPPALEIDVANGTLP